MRTIGSDDLADLARGAALLGTGGGGDPHVGRLLAEAALREHGPVTLVDVDEVPEDAVVLPVAMMGAPTVMVGKRPSADRWPPPCRPWPGTWAGPRPTWPASRPAASTPRSRS